MEPKRWKRPGGVKKKSADQLKSTLGYRPRPGTRRGVIIGGTAYGSAKTGEHFFSLDILDLDQPATDVQRVDLTFLAHGFSPHPRFPSQAALFEKRGPGGAYVDLLERRVLSVIKPIDGHAFYGHGAFSRDGELLFAVETELASGEGVISIRDGKSFEVLDQFPTYGARPHDCVLINDGQTLVVTNGGGTEESGQTPCVTFVEVRSRKLLDKLEVDNPRINTGHVALTRSGDLAVVSAPRDGLPEATSTGGLSLRYQGQFKHVAEPKELTDLMLGESLSVCIHEASGVVVVTNPVGNLVSFWHLPTQSPRAKMSLDHARGVTLTLDQQMFALSCGAQASLILIDATTFKPVPNVDPGNRRFSGSHIYTWAYPA